MSNGEQDAVKQFMSALESGQLSPDQLASAIEKIAQQSLGDTQMIEETTDTESFNRHAKQDHVINCVPLPPMKYSKEENLARLEAIAREMDEDRPMPAQTAIPAKSGSFMRPGSIAEHGLAPKGDGRTAGRTGKLAISGAPGSKPEMTQRQAEPKPKIPVVRPISLGARTRSSVSTATAAVIAQRWQGTILRHCLNDAMAYPLYRLPFNPVCVLLAEHGLMRRSQAEYHLLRRLYGGSMNYPCYNMAISKAFPQLVYGRHTTVALCPSLFIAGSTHGDILFYPIPDGDPFQCQLQPMSVARGGFGGTGTHAGMITGMVLHPDGGLAFTGARDHTVRAWDCHRCSNVAAFNFDRRTQPAALSLSHPSAPSPFVAVGCNDGVKLIDLVSMKIGGFLGAKDVTAVSIDPVNTNQVAVGCRSGLIQLWDMRQGLTTPLSTMPEPRPEMDIKTLLQTNRTRALLMRTAQTRGVRPLAAGMATYTADVRSVQFTADGRALLTTDRFGSVLRWACRSSGVGATHARLVQGGRAAVCGLSADPAGTAFGLGSKELRVFDVDTGASLATVEGFDSPITSLTAGRDSKQRPFFLATTAANMFLVRPEKTDVGVDAESSDDGSEDWG
ncbi:WD domain, G-beta repeat [Carpediemonas membranifera]|uniref:WD domain, G-beta repeat n=1 Tax=Carpediemonas membranifera TaxID=201153 RepID=A0A8J6DZK3_9EUKA|nr:WD domain, G-beta repeat [Carpediemonas membranifera]|eukprot:KAG9390521.1 WD domain, G-beta repeat [Carpediemonas membranifera]